MSDELKSFKIGDQKKPGIGKPAAKKAAERESSSVGFPRIEAVVEAEKPDLSGLQARHAQLSEMAAVPQASNKEKAAAKKAAVAYERAQDLVEYLLETKARMAQGGDKAAGSRR